MPLSRLKKLSRIARLSPNAENILRPGGYGKVCTDIRVQQDAPFYEQPECFNSELAAYAAS